MTEEVGAVTGDLELATHLKESAVEVTVRYAGADEWYAVGGGPIELGKVGSLSTLVPRELHERVTRHLTTPGRILDGNEEPVSLRGFSF